MKKRMRTKTVMNENDNNSDDDGFSRNFLIFSPNKTFSPERKYLRDGGCVGDGGCAGWWMWGKARGGI